LKTYPNAIRKYSCPKEPQEKHKGFWWEAKHKKTEVRSHFFRFFFTVILSFKTTHWFLWMQFSKPLKKLKSSWISGEYYRKYFLDWHRFKYVLC